MMSKIIGSLIPGLLLGFAFARAQGTTATLSGTVSDQAGAAVPEAVITIQNESTGWQRETKTNSDGEFTLFFLPPARYTVKATRQGFLATEIKNMVWKWGRNFLSRFRSKPPVHRHPLL